MACSGHRSGLALLLYTGSPASPSIIPAYPMESSLHQAIIRQSARTPGEQQADRTGVGLCWGRSTRLIAPNIGGIFSLSLLILRGGDVKLLCSTRMQRRRAARAQNGHRPRLRIMQ